MLKWDPNDFLICLGVDPEHDRDGVEHSYRVSNDGLILLTSVFQFDGDVYFSVYRDVPDAEPLIELKINGCPAIELVQKGGEDWLSFLPGRTLETPHDKGISIHRGVRVRAYPSIRVELFK